MILWMNRPAGTPVRLLIAHPSRAEVCVSLFVSLWGFCRVSLKPRLLNRDVMVNFFFFYFIIICRILQTHLWLALAPSKVKPRLLKKLLKYFLFFFFFLFFFNFFLKNCYRLDSTDDEFQNNNKEKKYGCSSKQVVSWEWQTMCSWHVRLCVCVLYFKRNVFENEI